MVKLDGRSDLYSLGCTMYHLLSGQLPFKGESSMDCIVGRITGKAVPIGQVRPGLPPRLVQTIEKLMAANPDDRYQTADEAAAALRSLVATEERFHHDQYGGDRGGERCPPTPAPASAPAGKAATTLEAPAPPGSGRDSVLEIEVGIASLTLGGPRDENQRNSGRNRGCGCLSDRRCSRALQAIDG